jgi:hypothetical protein
LIVASLFFIHCHDRPAALSAAAADLSLAMRSQSGLD